MMKILMPYNKDGLIVQNIITKNICENQIQQILKKPKKVKVKIIQENSDYVISIYSKNNLFLSLRKRYLNVKKAKDLIVNYLKK